jgi:aspartyl-tRNA(Asn)/glutamyl-tRNA(Gln) amidotransferase subunit A
MNLFELTISDANKKLLSGELTVKELLDCVFSQIERYEPEIDAFITILKDSSYKDAERIQRRIDKREDITPLTGIPVTVKDIFCAEGILTTCASKILSNFIPPYNSTVVKKLKEAGAIIIGKTNMDEFAMGSSTENSAIKKTKNPWDLTRVPGGSSGGSAAAVAMAMGFGSLGTDTGGSIRQPASFCGVVGLKPTYGRVSRYGMIAFASSLDQAGPFARTVKDCAILLSTIAGYDPMDSTSQDLPVPDYLSELTKEIKGLKLGIPKEYFIRGIDPEVEKIVKKSIQALEGLGAQVEEVTLPHTEYGLAVYYIIAPSEASSNLARYDGVKYGYRTQNSNNLMEMYMKTRAEGFGAEVKRRIMLGTYALSSGYYDAYYRKAQQVRRLVKEDFERAFEKVDAIVTPTSPTPAFKFGEKTADPLTMYLSDVFTIPVNLAGLPALSLSCGFTSLGLPVGLQIIGKPFDEGTILRIAENYERNTEWHRRHP